MLCRHRRHDVLRHVRQAQRLGTGLYVGDQLAPGFTLRLRPAGGTGSKQNGHHPVDGNFRLLSDSVRLRQTEVGQREGTQRRRQRAVVAIAQTQATRVIGRNFGECFMRMRCRLQAHSIEQQAGHEAERKVVTVVA